MERSLLWGRDNILRNTHSVGDDWVNIPTMPLFQSFKEWWLLCFHLKWKSIRPREWKLSIRESKGLICSYTERGNLLRLKARVTHPCSTCFMRTITTESAALGIASLAQIQLERAKTIKWLRHTEVNQTRSSPVYSKQIGRCDYCWCICCTVHIWALCVQYVTSQKHSLPQ